MKSTSASNSSIWVVCEVFHPEDFLNNDLVKQWESDGKKVEVLTRVPSYPFGRVYSGFKNRLYNKTSWGSIKIHHLPIIQGYQASTLRKILNYFLYVLGSLFFFLVKGNNIKDVFVYQTGPLTIATAVAFFKPFYKYRASIWVQDVWPDTVFAYGFDNGFIKKLLQWFSRYIYRSFDNILISCKGFSKIISQYTDKTLDYVPNWSLLLPSQESENQLNVGFNFTFAGNIGKMQNLENVLLAFKEVDVGKSVYFNIFGDGSSFDAIKTLVDEEDIKNVVFWGRKRMNDMPPFLASSDVLVLSLIDEPIYHLTIPSKFQTYLNFSKPIFAIIKGEVANIVNQNHLGLVADPNSVNDIANRFRDFIAMTPIELSRYSANSIRLLSEEFSRDVAISNINRLLQ